MDILVIDDDKFSQKMIGKVFKQDFTAHFASSGAEGIEKANALLPEIIILDVEMPQMNGYEVCTTLKQAEKTRTIPIIFLSGCGTLRERLQGYEVGGDDYLVKPFESETLLAKAKVLVKYNQEKKELHEQYEVAQKTAQIAMSGSSELGLTVRFIEDSFFIHDYESLANNFFTFTDRLGLKTTVLFKTDDQPMFFSSTGPVVPLEAQLLEMIHDERRIYDFGCRSVFNFPQVSVLIKNMPIDDMERYGRIKDLLPVILGALNGKILALNTEKALQTQSEQLIIANDNIKNSLLSLTNSLQINQQEITNVMRKMFEELTMHVPYLGLEEDQEEYLLDLVENAVDKSVNLIETNNSTREVFGKVLNEMQIITARQNQLIDLIFQHKVEAEMSKGHDDDYVMDVELF